MRVTPLLTRCIERVAVAERDESSYVARDLVIVTVRAVFR